MAARPVVSIFSSKGDKVDSSAVPLPSVFTTPIRPDLIQFVHKNMAKNHRQPYAVARNAGEQTSAESWGTGRAVARIPRVGGGGTHRAGQAAFGNMCRGGRMFSPNKVWRRWHVKTNTNQKRYAVASAVAASGVTSLVMSRGHRIEKINEVPLVISNDAESLTKTRDAVALLKALNAYADVEKVLASRKVRAGRGKMRNRTHRQRLGPLVVYATDNGITRAFRNIPGVELTQVSRLNLLDLAPGGHLGRFIIWTQAAFEALEKVFGSTTVASEQKSNYTLPQSILSNADITRIINSAEIQSALRAKGPAKVKRSYTQKKNPLRNRAVRVRLNPYAQTVARNEILGVNKKYTNKNQKTKKLIHRAKPESASKKFVTLLKSD
ncbi:60S ribosomal protein L4-A [Zancudomyces culisetae]|uniref:60S ribosomal protein L4-A n=1 Tax=Zancudomyces culisetae TaxID=1213189 RepID=A0A1R1PMR5_ZANCU|nr:60S ribosomal protein L4-A [Zancudomyces culisetae]|eukprot:OMH82248.1 60S ribosomal protein L4-A [Zancudomyces culisetae]